MDIVKRAYLKIKEDWENNNSVSIEESRGVLMFLDEVDEEIKRLIRVGAYSGRDWPRELGPLPDELRSKRQKQ